MREYIGLVTCKHGDDSKVLLFETPPWADLQKGDGVLVETTKGYCEATVECAFTARLSDTFHELDFILSACGATLPLKKVIAKVTYHKYQYEEDENGQFDQG